MQLQFYPCQCGSTKGALDQFQAASKEVLYFALEFGANKLSDL